MKKFAGPRDRGTVLAQCRVAGVEVDARAYEGGSDFTTLRGGGAVVIWRSYDGWFFGHYFDATGAKVEFDSNSADHENERWFQTLLEFFYVPKPRRPIPRFRLPMHAADGGVAW